MKWTEGPYQVLPGGEHVIVSLDREPYTDLAEFFHADEATVETTREEAIANATLYAAASDLAEAAAKAVDQCRYKTPVGTMNCRYCDADMDHGGTFKDMHAAVCVIRDLRAALRRAGA